LLKLSQEYLDELRWKQWKKLCQEITQYGKLKDKWGAGFVHLCRCKVVGNAKNKMELWGWYHDECNVKSAKFLGDSFEQALGRVNHVKSFL